MSLPSSQESKFNTRERSAIISALALSALYFSEKELLKQFGTLLFMAMISPNEYRAFNAIAVGAYSLFTGAFSAAPTVQNPIGPQTGEPGVPFSVPFQSDVVFNDLDNDALSIRAELVNGSQLPSWLNLNLYPSIVGNMDTPSWAYKIAIDSSKDVAFVADGTATLAVDISNSSSMSVLGSMPTLDANYGVISKDYITYSANWGAGFDIVDWRNLTNPVLLARKATQGSAVDLDESNGKLFVSDNVAGVSIYDVSNSSNPAFLNGINTGGYVEDTNLIGDNLTVADNTGGVLTYDVRDVGNPISLGSFPTPDQARGVAHRGATTFVATYGRGLYSLDATNASNPVYLDDADTPGLSFQVINYGENVVVADGSAGAQVYSAHNVPGLAFLGNCPATGEVRGVAYHPPANVLMASGTAGIEDCYVGAYKLEGTPPSPTYFDVKVIANDGNGGEASTIFRVNIGNVPEPTTGSTLSTTGATSQSLTSTSAAATTSSTSATSSVPTSTNAVPLDTSGAQTSLESADLTWLWVVVGVGALAIAAIALGVYLYRRNNVVSSSDDIVLTDTSGSTGDGVSSSRKRATPADDGGGVYNSTGDVDRGSIYNTMNPDRDEENNYQTTGNVDKQSPHVAESIYNNRDAVVESDDKIVYQNATAVLNA